MPHAFVARILDPDPLRPWLASRTRRSLKAAGFSVDPISSTPCLMIGPAKCSEFPSPSARPLC